MRPFAEIARNPRVEIKARADDGGWAMVRRNAGAVLKVIFSTGAGWDHVSVSLANRTPTYQEMKMVKRIFFKADEWAVEYHPPSAAYVSDHDNVLHLWRPHGVDVPRPPMMLV